MKRSAGTPYASPHWIPSLKSKSPCLFTFRCAAFATSWHFSIPLSLIHAYICIWVIVCHICFFYAKFAIYIAGYGSSSHLSAGCSNLSFFNSFSALLTNQEFQTFYSTMKIQCFCFRNCNFLSVLSMVRLEHYCPFRFTFLSSLVCTCPHVHIS